MPSPEATLKDESPSCPTGYDFGIPKMRRNTLGSGAMKGNNPSNADLVLAKMMKEIMSTPPSGEGAGLMTSVLELLRDLGLIL